MCLSNRSITNEYENIQNQRNLTDLTDHEIARENLKVCEVWYHELQRN